MWFLLIYLIIGALFVSKAKKALADQDVEITLLNILVWAIIWPVYAILFVIGLIKGYKYAIKQTIDKLTQQIDEDES